MENKYQSTYAGMCHSQIHFLLEMKMILLSKLSKRPEESKYEIYQI